MSQDATATRAGTDSRSSLVTIAGSATTLLALFAVFTAMHHGVNVMGWYANYVIPIGAIGVGALAASGYGIAAWKTGLKMSRKLTLSVFAELAIAYILAHYSEYSEQLGDRATLAGFFGWFDEATRAIAFVDHGKTGDPLGLLGYGVRALELGGFLAGGVLIPLSMAKLPYCDPCRIYKRTTQVAALPAGLPLGQLRKSTPEQRQAAWTSARDGLELIFGAAEAGDRARFAGELQQRGAMAEARATRKLAAHAAVHLQRCPSCSDGTLVAQLVSGHGKQRKVQPLQALALPPARVQQLFD